jgi:hypothetical protein
VPVVFAPAQNSVPASDVVEKLDLILAELRLSMIDGIQQLVEVLFFDDLDLDQIQVLDGVVSGLSFLLIERIGGVKALLFLVVDHQPPYDYGDEQQATEDHHRRVKYPSTAKTSQKR